MPRPRKESDVTARIVSTTSAMAKTIAGVTALGRIWAVTMRLSVEPKLRAAWTYSSSRSTSTSPRVMRAKEIQFTSRKAR